MRFVVVYDSRRIHDAVARGIVRGMTEWGLQVLPIPATSLDDSPVIFFNLDNMGSVEIEKIKRLIYERIDEFARKGGDAA